jgi:hypothetical protein
MIAAMINPSPALVSRKEIKLNLSIVFPDY